MHRFYVVHSFKNFHRHVSNLVCVCVFVYTLNPPSPLLQLVATASLFLAAKSEEQPRKLQYVAQASYACLNKEMTLLDIQSQVYTVQSARVKGHQSLSVWLIDIYKVSGGHHLL